MSSYFTEEELRCKCGCNKNYFDETFLHVLNTIRGECGFALPVSSGYRCPEHPIEAAKDKPGAHSTGKAVDINISGWKAYRLVENAIALGVWRIGVNQKGTASQRFIHLDACHDLPEPVIWSY
jgi:uncharacterized protein YcbK (DUF882 family)